MGQLAHVLVHTATLLRYEEDGVAWIEGEPGDGPEPTLGESFACVLFLPLGTEDDSGARSRKVSRPTILWEPPARLGADDELLILAPELADHFEQAPGRPVGTGRWQVDGEPQPFGPPGKVIGTQATLKQVRA